MVTFISKSPEDTQNLGAQWGREAREGSLIGLIGDLGAGKTQLVKGIAQGLGISDRITSPTFTLVHQYSSGRLPLCHIDLYRLDTPSQISSAGLDDYVYAPRGVTVVEWIDRWFGAGHPASWSPVDHLAASSGFGGASSTSSFYRQVRIEIVNETERRISYDDFGR